MKNLLTLSIICVLSFPIFVSAIAPGTIPEPGDYGINTGGLPSDANGLLNILRSVVTWVYKIFFIVAVLFIIFAAFNYLTGADAPEKIKSAHSQLIYAAIAIAVALLSVGFIAIIEDFLIAPGSTQGGSNVQIQTAPETGNPSQ